MEANHFLAEDMEHAMKKAAEEEKSELGKKILLQLQENLKIAGEEMTCLEDNRSAIFIKITAYQTKHLRGNCFVLSTVYRDLEWTVLICQL